MEHETNGDTNCWWCAWYSHQRNDNGTEGLGNKRTSGDHPNDSITNICKNTEKSPGDLKRLVSKTPVEDHRQTLL